MKQKILAFTIIMVLAFNINAQLKTVMTFNIRLDTKNDKQNQWSLRKNELANLITYYSPDVIGVQEALPQQMDYLDNSLVDYSYIGVGRDDGKREGEFSAIFYKKSALKIIKNGVFWLSETPDKVSFGWDAACKRICTYALFENKKTNKKTWVLNTHFDHQGKKARIESMKLIMKKINDLNLGDKYPLVLMGDFNMTPEHESIKIIQTLLQDSYNISQTKHYGPVGTFNDFDLLKILYDRIDYIFTKGYKVLKHRHIEDRRANNLCVSDHLPVMVELE